MPDPRPAAHLPVLDVIDDVLVALDGPGAAVLVAPPGTGKTTAVPPVLARQGWADDGRIVVVEPRRLAARAAAARMSEVADEPVGATIGYSVRGDRKVGPTTRVEVVTEGLFLRRLQSDPTLDGVAAVLLDEFHERSADLDLALALLIDVRASLRPDLRLMAMSATIDPTPLAALLGAPDGPAPIVTAISPLHPVDRRYRPGSSHDALEEQVADVVRDALRDDPGDVLVFLPGRAEIRRTRRALERHGAPTRGPGEVFELHGSMSPEEQDRVVRPRSTPERRVILSTSLAETSITVPGVRVVVDAGRRRTIRVDPHTGLPALRTTAVSRAGADQRSGRAGRESPGVSYRLWAEADERHRPAVDPPEVLDGDLAPLLLQVRAWGVEGPGSLRWVDEPDPGGVARAAQLLEELGAVGSDGRLTARGRAMAEIGFHPRVAAVAIEGRRRGRADVAAEVIAVLETSRAGGTDLVERVRALRRGDMDGEVRHALRLWRRTLRTGEDGRRAGADEAGLDGLVAQLLVAGYADRLARRRDAVRRDEGHRGHDRAVYHLRSGGEVAVRSDDPLAGARWWVVVDLDAGAPGEPGRPHLVAPLDDDAVAELVEPLLSTEDVVRWDPRGRDVVAERRRHLGAITVATAPLAEPPSDAIAAAVADGLRQHGLDLLAGTERADDLRRRVAWLRAVTGATSWPDWSEAALADDAGEWLAPHLGRVRRAADLDRVDVRAALLSRLDHAQRRTLDQLAPTHWTTGSGRRVALRYGEVDGAPATVLAAVALRDVIGTDVHPTVGPSRTPITLELLSPAGRPVQRTTDLPGFWRGSYASVRSELRGRYPKHPWPERPWEPLPRRGG